MLLVVKTVTYTESKWKGKDTVQLEQLNSDSLDKIVIIGPENNTKD